MRRLRRVRFKFLSGQKGISLIENLVAVGILAAIGVAFMSALFTGYRSVGILDEKQQAETLIRSQLEDIKSGPYQESGEYPIVVELPPQYSMSITVTPPMHIGTLDNNVPLEELLGYSVTTIQEITVSVSHGGKPVLSVACYKAIQ